jgi:hypothetical protein
LVCSLVGSVGGNAVRFLFPLNVTLVKHEKEQPKQYLRPMPVMIE